jgi:hypothetical protein
MTEAYEIVDHDHDVVIVGPAGQECARRSEWPHRA